MYSKTLRITMTTKQKLLHIELLKDLWSNPTPSNKSKMSEMVGECNSFETIPNVSKFEIKELARYHPVLAEGAFGDRTLVRMGSPKMDGTNLMENGRKIVNFCNNKVIIVTAVINGHDFSFHHNVLIK